MAFNFDLLLVINTFFCVSILTLGIFNYMRKKESVFIYIGIAFGLFGTSHIMNIFGLGEKLFDFLITIRTVAYLLVSFGLISVINKMGIQEGTGPNKQPQQDLKQPTK